MQQLSYERIQVLLSHFLKEKEKSFCFITAPSGTGKTTALRTFCHKHDEAVYMKLPLAVLRSPKSVILAILESLEIPHVKSHQYKQLIKQLSVVLGEKQVSSYDR